MSVSWVNKRKAVEHFSSTAFLFVWYEEENTAKYRPVVDAVLFLRRISFRYAFLMKMQQRYSSSSFLLLWFRTVRTILVTRMTPTMAIPAGCWT